MSRFRFTATRFLATAIASLFALSGTARADTVIDLTVANSSGSFTVNDYFTNDQVNASGTGLINSFVRISGNTDIVEGYNTDHRPLQFDENSSPTFTKSLQLSSVSTVLIAGVVYRQFLLDINQNKPQPLLSLSELQIFVGNTGSPNGATVDVNGTLNFGLQAALVYDMDSSGNGNSILLDYNLNTGSGGSDMFAYIESSLFGTDPDSYVTLYSKFGDPNVNNDGFEEWAVADPPTFTPDPPVVPVPSSLVMLGSMLLPAFSFYWVRRRNALIAA